MIRLLTTCAMTWWLGDVAVAAVGGDLSADNLQTALFAILWLAGMRDGRNS